MLRDLHGLGGGHIGLDVVSIGIVGRHGGRGPYRDGAFGFDLVTTCGATKDGSALRDKDCLLAARARGTLLYSVPSTAATAAELHTIDGGRWRRRLCAACVTARATVDTGSSGWNQQHGGAFGALVEAFQIALLRHWDHLGEIMPVRFVRADELALAHTAIRVLVQREE